MISSEKPSGPPLARTTLDRAAEHRRDEEWLAAAWDRGQVLVVDLAKGGRALVTDRPDGGAALTLVPSSAAPEAERWFLGVGPDGTPYWAVDAPLETRNGVRATGLRESGHLLDDLGTGLLTTAVALGNWHRSHRYSPRTGKPTEVVEAGWARVDPDGVMMWPRTDPAMIILVHDGVPGPLGRCLLGHNAAWPPRPDGGRRFSCLAGFVEAGESAEAAVAREVYEEVGIGLSEIRYEGSQSWPYPGSLMLGFHGIADPAEPLTLDPEEIDEAHWFTREDVGKMFSGEGSQSIPMSSSIAFYLIEKWLLEDSENISG
ncbi:NADH pyrophosphatase [Actinoplanes philippinensis]|uniref:NAD(+) diphosphatase n=1 Tax=Actinoplanes philippinensis TaxID=35752 RepID=A0A1I2J2Y7_9ACTN|nr:NAD(+) diphosphatase [Actinoplanes philippinensis]GIE79594.1 NADH pyrophosphatase [Actinoplanes philippinensis]SFF49035.1 NAD+ diphosphatase [Actinoplanes philippinensis]